MTEKKYDHVAENQGKKRKGTESLMGRGGGGSGAGKQSCGHTV